MNGKPTRAAFIALGALIFIQPAGATGFKRRSSTRDGRTTYEFVVKDGNAANRWSSSKEPPPLSAHRARSLATRFMKDVPAPEAWHCHPEQTNLEQVSTEPEQWVYEIVFNVVPNNSKEGFLRTGPPGFAVIVQMDGSIPGTKITQHGAEK